MLPDDDNEFNAVLGRPCLQAPKRVSLPEVVDMA
jgi:hypothetical protein